MRFYDGRARPLPVGRGARASRGMTDPVEPRGGAPLVALLFAAVLLAYTAIALARGWWPSAVASPVVAWLLWRRHRRARFAAYIFFSVMAARALLSASWPLGLFALAAILALQLPAARRAWPRLTPRAPLR